MNRREFSAGAACLLAAAALSPATLLAQGRQPQEGTDYLALKRPVNVSVAPGQVEVIEFFWYSCPHCNAFEPQLESWIKRLPPDVAMKRVPVAFREDFVPQQRLYYTLEALGKVDELHAKVFHAIHVERMPVSREDSILDWAGKQGLDKAKFTELYHSFDVVSKARRATQLQDAFQVQGVPAMGIAGRYYTDGTIAGNTDRMLQVTDYLISQVRKKS
ncbi:MAG TPA: thiol:disulfide interchange protein DsbA/DsbL [Ramlibacter sp.]|jgi:thiol:disulfide interchange protein DsbA|nr:thiol:disulfide interchange protein DsbA/DsbL [Ramlibacter sp.]